MLAAGDDRDPQRLLEPDHGKRIQVNANHRSESIAGLLDAFAALRKVIAFPAPEAVQRRAA